MSDMQEQAHLNLEQLRRIKHDIGNPLSRLGHAIYVIKHHFKNKNYESANEFIANMAQDVEQIGNILYSTNVLVENESPVKSDIDLFKIAKNNYDATLRDCNETSNQTVRFEAGENVVIANADPKLMDMVFSNLIKNSFKYRKQDEDTVITFGVTQKDSQKVYFLKDNGKGFDNSHCKDIFGLGFRTPDAEISKVYGSGQGLYTVKKIIEAHGGSVWAESEINKGTSVFFTL